MARKKRIKKKVEPVVEKQVTEAQPETQAVLKEQFASKRSIVAMETLGYKKCDLTENAGFSLPEPVRKKYIAAVRRGELVYLTK